VIALALCLEDAEQLRGEIDKAVEELVALAVPRTSEQAVHQQVNPSYSLSSNCNPINSLDLPFISASAACTA
jgi:hypothetical protein